jgi:multidrug resistance protein MdtO
MSKALRLALATSITLLVIMVFRLPYPQFGLFFAFLTRRGTPILTLRASLYVLATLLATVALLLVLMAATENAPITRLLSLSVMAFVAGVLIHEASIPVLGSVCGLLWSRLLPLWEGESPANAIVERSLGLILTLAVALGATVLVEYLFAHEKPAARLQQERVRRYAALEKMFSLCARGVESPELTAAVEEVVRIAAGGQVEMQAIFASMAERHLTAGPLPPGMHVRIAMLARLMDLSAAFGTQFIATPHASVCERCARIASVCRQLQLADHISEEDRRHLEGSSLGTSLERVEAGLSEILSMPEITGPGDRRDLVYVPPQHVSLLPRGAFSNPEALSFALKVSGCASFCYVCSYATGWPGLTTSVVTVVVTALAGTGALTQRLAFRLLGVVVGSLLLGLGTVAVLFPNMETIASLIVLVAAMAFVFAWFEGGRQFSYLGTQLAFCFYTVAITEHSPTTVLTPARDNFVGISFATIVMWVVFDQLWPTTTSFLMTRMLASVLRDTSELLDVMESVHDHATRVIRARILRHHLGRTIEELRAGSELIPFELGLRRARESERAGRLLNVALAVASFFWGRLAVIYGEHDPVIPASPELARIRREASRELAAFADALEGRGQGWPRRAMPQLPEPTEADVRADKELVNARTSYLRIRNDLLDLQG